MFCKLRYSAAVSMTGAGVNSHVFSANGLFDPDITAAGSQPQSFDEFAAFFQRYRGNACFIRVTYINLDSDSVDIVTVPSSGASVYATIRDAASAPMAKHDLLAPSGSAGDRKIHTMYISPKKFQGWKDYTDDQTALVTANPTDQAYYHIYSGQNDASAVTVDVIVDLIYYAKFYDFTRS